MAETLFSSSWYRIASLQPRFRKHAQLHRHEYRGEVWYILQNHANGQFFRFTPVVYHVIALMDGLRTVQQLWDIALERFGDEAPTQDDILRLLSQLHSADVLICDLPPDTRELFKRGERVRQSKIRQYLFSPLSWRIPLLDPEKFLGHLGLLSRLLFNPWSALLWSLTVAVALVLAVMHRAELTNDVIDRVLAMNNIVLLWLVYPFIKVVHEMGHALAVKRWNGEVHEMGIMLLVLMPVPYVDASAASAFPERKQRALVSAAGIMVELFLASLALFVWISVEPGTIRSAAYNIIFIGGVSTLLFNGNPLLRYDGYYILADLLGIPNLSQRGQEFAAYLSKRYLFGLKKTEPLHTTPREKFWLVTYFISSFIYRIIVYVGIVLFISGKFFFIGVLLGIWAAISMAVIPLWKALRFVATSPALREKRARAVLSTSAILALFIAAIFIVPFPLWTRAEGVVWIPEELLVRAGSSGFIQKVVSKPGAVVKKGDLLVIATDPEMVKDYDLQLAQLRLLEAKYTAEVVTDRLKARIIREEMEPVKGGIARLAERIRDLNIISPGDGRFVLPNDSDLPGRFMKKGELVGYVLKGEQPTVRVVVKQSDVDLIRNSNRSIKVRIANRIGSIVPAKLIRETPAGSERLPSTSLGSAGGGQVAIDPSDREGVKTFERTFQLDLELPLTYAEVNVNERVYVRFDHHPEPLASQFYRALRRLLMRRFNV